MPAVVGLAGRYGARGLRVVSVVPVHDVESAADRDAYTEITRTEHMTYPCYLDVRSNWSRSTGLGLRPSFLVIGRDGKVAFRLVEVLSPGSPALQQLTDAIEHALGAAS